MIRTADNATEIVAPITRRFGIPAGLEAEETRLYSQIPTEVDYIYNNSFSAASTEEKLFGPQTPRIERSAWKGFSELAEDAQPRRRVNLKQEEEAQLFLQFNYARYRLAKLVAAQTRRASLLRAKAMLHWHRRASEARDALVEFNMALVLSMAKKVYFSSVDLGDLISEGNIALLRSVEKFDVARGYRFSTYACGSILKAFGRLAQKVGRYRHLFPMEYDPELEQGDAEGERHDSQWSESVDELLDVIARNKAGLTKLERTVIMERFALATRDQGRTLAQVGQRIGLTNERVRQIQNRALGKLRQVLAG
jgi:RNA polymerase sigma factor (sigma-70 family)